MPVLLVIIGGVGDWCVRRVLAHALKFESLGAGHRHVAVVDVHPRYLVDDQDNFAAWIAEVDRWIVRRLIEQSAEELDQPLRDESGRATKGIDWGFAENLARNPSLPDPTELGGPNPDAAVDQFVRRAGPAFEAAYRRDVQKLNIEIESRLSGYFTSLEELLAGDPVKLSDWARGRGLGEVRGWDALRGALTDVFARQVTALSQKAQIRFESERQSLLAWLQQPVFEEMGALRYWRADSGDGAIIFHCRNSDGSTKRSLDHETLQSIAEKYRIIVYSATPPPAYVEVLKFWSSYAERIAFEKPIAGLIEQAPLT